MEVRSICLQLLKGLMVDQEHYRTRSGSPELGNFRVAINWAAPESEYPFVLKGVTLPDGTGPL